MFNPLNILHIVLITTGVATATPVYNAKTEKQTNIQIKKENTSNYITDYEIYLPSNITGSSYFDNERVTESYTGRDTEVKTEYNASTSYLNIRAINYRTITSRTINNGTKYYYQNYEKIIGNTNNVYENTSRELIVMQITPYNYNVNTSSEITLAFNVGDWTDSNGDEIIVEKQYILRNIYQTIQDDWSTYLDRQITAFTAKRILNDIKDPNNYFYYTTLTNLEEVTNGNTISQEFTINIQPNKTNYIMIDLVKVVKAKYYDYGTDTLEDFGTNESMVPLIMYQDGINGFYIYGTNVIPQGGTYEVIDLPGLMWQILTMPFAFVSQAFNLTLFPNTPYQINISNLFLSIIAIFVFVWLIGLFLKLKG